jgi:hypothetical protein
MSYLNPTNQVVPFVLNIHLSEIEFRERPASAAVPGSDAITGSAENGGIDIPAVPPVDAVVPWEAAYVAQGSAWMRDFDAFTEFKNFFMGDSVNEAQSPFINHFGNNGEYLFYTVYKITNAINNFISNLMNINVLINPNIILVKLLGCAKVTQDNAQNIWDIRKISMGFKNTYYKPQSSSYISGNAAAVKTAMVGLFDFLTEPGNTSNNGTSLKISFLFMRQRFCFLLKISPGGETGIQYDNLLLSDPAAAEDVFAIISGTTGRHLYENTGSEQIVYTIITSNAIGTVDYTIGGADGGSLTLIGNVVKLNVNPDNTKAEYSFTVVANDDNTSDTITVTFEIIDEPDIYKLPPASAEAEESVYRLRNFRESNENFLGEIQEMHTDASFNYLDSDFSWRHSLSLDQRQWIHNILENNHRASSSEVFLILIYTGRFIVFRNTTGGLVSRWDAAVGFEEAAGSTPPETDAGEHYILYQTVDVVDTAPWSLGNYVFDNIWIEYSPGSVAGDSDPTNHMWIRYYKESANPLAPVENAITVWADGDEDAVVLKVADHGNVLENGGTGGVYESTLPGKDLRFTSGAQLLIGLDVGTTIMWSKGTWLPDGSRTKLSWTPYKTANKRSITSWDIVQLASGVQNIEDIAGAGNPSLGDLIYVPPVSLMGSDADVPTATFYKVELWFEDAPEGAYGSVNNPLTSIRIGASMNDDKQTCQPPHPAGGHGPGG